MPEIARELARINLPLSLYTEWYWKIDLHNLLHFLSLRLDVHAQKEIRLFAEAIEHFQAALKILPDDKRLRRNLGIAFLRARKNDKPFYIYMAPPVPHSMADAKGLPYTVLAETSRPSRGTGK